jgi:hypothetical protein
VGCAASILPGEEDFRSAAVDDGGTNDWTIRGENGPTQGSMDAEKAGKHDRRCARRDEEGGVSEYI